ncbi:cytosolic phospholipase A2 gamma-like [Chanodichthys erythropterus]|uniref:cytosolic phospholipase A2 gamma-like n=1 Tax=Chanodichthys erythropterus TaxID=933992 RepID=UPI00351DD5A3
MSASKPQESGEVRIEPSLNKNEAEFIDGRRKSVLQSLKKLQIKCSQNEVPNIALLGSGGGQRAMVGLLGSLVQLQKTGLLDSILYLSGVSGSTWCMASVYQEPDWSTKLDTVKNKIIKRLSGPGVSWKEALAKLKKYYSRKDYFSLTDFWAVMVITSYVKEIDEHTLTEQWSQHSKDGKVPFPIYTVIDKTCKHHNIGDPWFEITPHEAGYSLTGAFVDASNFGSKFHKGSKKNQQDEFDMLYLQALCGSALADEVEIKKQLCQKIKGRVKHLLEVLHISEYRQEDPTTPASDEECYQMLMNLVDMNLSVLTGKDPSAFDESIRTLNVLSGGQSRSGTLRVAEAYKLDLKSYATDVFNSLSEQIEFLLIRSCKWRKIEGLKYDGTWDLDGDLRDIAWSSVQERFDHSSVSKGASPNPSNTKTQAGVLVCAEGLSLRVPQRKLIKRGSFYPPEEHGQNGRIQLPRGGSSGVKYGLHNLSSETSIYVAGPLRGQARSLRSSGRYSLNLGEETAERASTWETALNLADAWMSIIKCMNQWTWGRNYNFLHDMTGEAVPSTLQETETRDYEDAGLLLNSPYFSVLRKERDIDLIISLDFSEGDPFMTVKEAAKMCRELNIPFPEVNIPSEDVKNPKDLYVFKGKNTPTVIHIPLFNVVNCGDKIETWRKSYKTFQGPYSAKEITDLMEVAGKNITNNKGKLVEQIRAAVGQKGSRR